MFDRTKGATSEAYTVTSFECIAESRSQKQGIKSTSGGPLTGKSIYSTHPCRYSDTCKKDTSLQNELVTRKATSYLMAAKGLLRKVNDKVNRLDSLYSINVK